MVFKVELTLRSLHMYKMDMLVYFLIINKFHMESF